MRRSPLYGMLLVAAAGCGSERIVDHADVWREADLLFRRDTRWVGGDGAVTIPLGPERTLWLFGDTFLSRGDAPSRDGALFLRNSAAIQTGRDPSRAFMEFYWEKNPDGPGSFVPERGAEWLWPGQGARLGDTLLLFYGRLHAENAGLGYAGDSWTAFAVDDPDDEPSRWALRELAVPASYGVDVGAAAFVDGDFLDVAGERGDAHDVFLVRWPLADAAHGDLSHPSWWCGGAGWAEPAACADPAVVIPGAAPELSIHFDARAGRYLEFETTGFGATELGVRSAPRPEGPWSDVERFLRPPESFEDNAFVYAGKAHPELAGGDVVLTYVPSAFPEDHIDNPDYYYPRFARATLVHR